MYGVFAAHYMGSKYTKYVHHEEQDVSSSDTIV